MTAPPAERDPLYARGVTLVLLGALVLSSGGPIIRQVEAASDWQIAFFRGVAQTIMVMCVLAVLHRGKLVTAFRNAGRTGLIGGVALGLGNVCYILSISNTTIANTMFLLSIVPFLTAIAAWVALRERVRPASWVAICVATLGVAVMVQDGVAERPRVRQHHGAGGGLQRRLLLRRRSCRPAVRHDPHGVHRRRGRGDLLRRGRRRPDLFTISAHDLFFSSLMGFGQVGIGMLLYTVGARYVRAAELSILSLTEFIISPIWGWLIVGEIPTSATLLGGVVILGAVGGLALWSVRRPAPALG